MTPWNAMKADTFRLHGKFSWGRLIRGALTHGTFRAIVTMRLCQCIAASNCVVRLALPFFKILHHMATYESALGLHWKTEIGPGFLLTHGWGSRVSKGVRIGKNVTVLHGATIGQRHKISPNGERLILFPVLEDEVFVGPYAIIVGGVTIGRGSRIAGGSFVTESVPPYSTVLGNPAKIVRSNCVPDVMNPAQV
jgi:serine O-acetyltransferase